MNLPDNCKHTEIRTGSTWSLLWLLIGVSVVGCNSLALSPILSDLSAAFNQSPADVARAAAAYGGATAFASFFLARNGENFGMRKMLRVGTILLIIGIGTSALATNWIMLTFSQATAGLAAGVMLPAIYAMASSIAPQGKESVYVGRVITGWSLAMVFGIPLAAIISDLWGWRVAYLSMAAICFVSLIGFSKLPSYKRQQKTKTLSAKQVLMIPDVLVVLIICLLFMFSFYGIYIFIGDYARTALSISASSAGLLVMAYGIGFALASAGNPVIDQYGPKRSMRLVLLIISSIYASMYMLTNGLIPLILICAAWGGANHFGLNCILVILNTADLENKAAIMGIYTAITYFATMLATLLFGFLYNQFEFSVLITVAMVSCLIAALVAIFKLNP